MLTVTKAWKDRFPGAVVGVLSVTGVANPKAHAGLDARKREIEESIRSRYSGMERAELRGLERIAVYAAYYKRQEIGSIGRTSFLTGSTTGRGSRNHGRRTRHHRATSESYPPNNMPNYWHRPTHGRRLTLPNMRRCAQ